ncbi:hypothetical protein RHMOL_Rhmol13G0148300 [Rhododendron molle]|uniref:Uncharacterized protein n=1 Tax=Rhododendron molle TaxID=49168 RepID=A0ACC0L6S2_RHOML|nr:hypothetical protein RHMOL_Rhmol13G0148300 [Rhododendron molle]
MVAVMNSLQFIPTPIPPQISSSSSSSSNKGILKRRSTILFTAASVLAPYLQLLHPNSKPSLSSHSAIALQQDELDPVEDRVVQLFQDTSPSVVFIKDLQLAKTPKSSEEVLLIEDENVKVEGTGSGFIWDKFGHIMIMFCLSIMRCCFTIKRLALHVCQVTNYHVVEKLATDRSGLQRCKVFLVDAKGNSFSREAKIVGFDPAYDLAVLKVDVEGSELKPVILGTSRDLHVGQSCFAIGNPYGYEDTLTTGVFTFCNYTLIDQVPSVDYQRSVDISKL